ncbi:MAG TPA: cell division protein ZapA [Sphingomonas sp.]
MAQVRLDIGGRQYDVACRDGEEERLRMLGRFVDARAADVIRSVGRGNEARELLLTALLLADELDDARAAQANARLEDESRAAAIERCAERLETLAARLESPGADA